MNDEIYEAIDDLLRACHGVINEYYSADCHHCKNTFLV